MLSFRGKKEIIIFAAYAKEDKVSVKKFLPVLKMLSRLEKITCYDRDISPGREWRQEEHERLQEADIILLLVSWKFLESDYCYGEQLGQAIERHNSGQARVIPVVLHACPWQDSPLKVLVPLPEDGKPINSWPSWPEALTNIYDGIKEVIEELQNPQPFQRYQA